MKVIKIFFMISVYTFICSSCNSNPPSKWMDYVRESMSFNLHNHKTTILDLLFYTKNKYEKIQNVCYLESYRNCNGIVKGLCGSVEIATDRLMDCLWKLHVPHNLCINVTIINFPNGDSFVDDYFLLSVKDKSKPQDAFGINFHINQQATNVFTNTSQSFVKLQIKKLFMVSMFTLNFQAVDCNIIISYNTITIINQGGDIFHARSKVEISTNNSERNRTQSLFVRAIQAKTTVTYNTFDTVFLMKHDSIWRSPLFPYLYSPHYDMVEYHFLLRTAISSYVQVITFSKHSLTLYDGPTFRSPKLNMNCQGNKICNTTASSFQVYVIYKQYNENSKHSNLSFKAVYFLKRKKLIRLDDSINGTFSWDLRNTSQTIYETIHFWKDQPRQKFIDFRILPVHFEKSPHGFLCQFNGLLVKYRVFMAEEAFSIGPICTEVQMSIVKNESFTSLAEALEIIIYSYGQTISKGSIIIPKRSMNNTCFTIINPCRVCHLDYTSFLFFSKSLSLFKQAVLNCPSNRIPVFQVWSECISVKLTPNYLSGTERQCRFEFISTGATDLKYSLLVRHQTELNQFCNVEVPDMEDSKDAFAEMDKNGIRFKEYKHHF